MDRIQNIEKQLTLMGYKTSPRLFVDEPRYNCWGFVAYALGWIPRIYWLSYDTMERLFHENSDYVKEPQFGDLVICYTDDDSDYFDHAALYMSHNRVLHKPGSNPLEVGSLSRYNYGKSLAYFRPRN